MKQMYSAPACKATLIVASPILGGSGSQINTGGYKDGVISDAPVRHIPALRPAFK